MKIITIALLAGTAALAGCATLEETAAELTNKTYSATLTGANEPGGGDPDGFGEAEVSVADRFGQVCYDVKNLRGLAPITAMHIHYGKAGVNGPPVLTLTKSNEGNWEGCKDGKEWTENRIQGNPMDFYVNVHTTEFPNGAIRGQLMD